MACIYCDQEEGHVKGCPITYYCVREYLRGLVAEASPMKEMDYLHVMSDPMRPYLPWFAGIIGFILGGLTCAWIWGWLH